ncbi:ExbD/TolR family protein [Anaerohalosphaera lusitana]|nr:biopolymer transporter ExbD [Anaerohalosphaera lusitana]
MEADEHYIEDGGRLRLEAFEKPKSRKIALRMLPLIDVIFLLLAFFVLTANFRLPEDFMSIKLPKRDARIETYSAIEPLNVQVTNQSNGCRVVIGGRAQADITADDIDTGLAEFANAFRSVADAQGRYAGDPVEIRCDDEVTWEYLVKIYDVLGSMGMDDVTFCMNESWGRS